MKYEYEKKYERDDENAPGFVRIYDMKTLDDMNNALNILAKKRDDLDGVIKDVTVFEYLNPQDGNFLLRVETYRDFLDNRGVCQLFEAVEDLMRKP